MSQLPIAWYLARSAGLVAFGLLTLTMWLGLAMSTRLLGVRRQKALVGWHDTLAWTALAAVALHVGALVADPVMRFGLPAVLIPGASPWRPAAVAAGVVAGWLALALTVSFRLRRRIGQRTWRRLHYASFAAFVLSVAHAVTAGTDLAGLGGPLLAMAAGGPVLMLTLVRILLPRGGASARRAPLETRESTT